MFRIDTKKEQGFDVVILSEEGTGTSAMIVPACGAMLHAFTVLQNGSTVNVIDSYDDADDYRQHQTSKGFKSSKLSPFACRIKGAAYHFGLQQYVIHKFLLGRNALHGLLYDALFSVTGEEVTEDHAAITMVHHYRGNEDSGYPFAYDCIVGYTLEKGNRLTVATTIVNKSKGLIPVQDGWHPYFTLGKKIDECLLEFQSKEILEFDEELIPTGRLLPYQEFGSLKKMGSTSFDNCFTVNFAECQPMGVLRNAEDKIQVEIYPGKSYPYLQLYTPPHRNSIAIENLTAAPDAFNNGMGLITLSPGETTTFETTYKITLL